MRAPSSPAASRSRAVRRCARWRCTRQPCGAGTGAPARGDAPMRQTARQPIGSAPDRRIGASRAYTISIAIAVASPPPMHSAATPRLPPVFFSAPSSVTTMRAPEAPIGWPSAQAPPWTLTLSCGMLELVHRRHRHRGEGFVDLEQVDVARRSSRSSCSSFCDRADRRGGEPVRLLRVGRVADDAGDRRAGRACSAVDSRISTSAAAPSEIDEDDGGGDRAVLLERRLQRRDLVELGLERALRPCRSRCRPCGRRR